MFDATGFEPKSRKQLFKEAPLWDKVRHALADMETAEADPCQVIRMNDWISCVDVFDDICGVCMAGAVMRNSYGIQKNVLPVMELFSPEEQRIFSFLDFARRGEIDLGLSINLICEFSTADLIYLQWRERIGGMEAFRQYEQDREVWFKQMHCLADVLEENKICGRQFVESAI